MHRLPARRSAGTGSVPDANPPVSRLTTIEFYGRWIEVEGVVRDVLVEGFLKLMLRSEGERVWVHLPPRSRSALPVSWLETKVRFRGAALLDVDGDGQPQAFVLNVPSTNLIEFLSPRRHSSSKIRQRIRTHHPTQRSQLRSR